MRTIVAFMLAACLASCGTQTGAQKQWDAASKRLEMAEMALGEAHGRERITDEQFTAAYRGLILKARSDIDCAKVFLPHGGPSFEQLVGSADRLSEKIEQAAR